MEIHRKKPKRLRPVIRNPIAERFWEYCQANGLIMDATATIAIEEWLNKQDRKAPAKIAS